MAKMVPTGAKQSMLDEPSRGSKQTTYFPYDKQTGVSEYEAEI